MALSTPVERPLGAAIIHPSAIIEHGAKLGAGVSIGPFCHVGADVTLEEGVTLFSHVGVVEPPSVGPRTPFYPFASFGPPPQDLKYSGEPVRLLIGPDC